MREPPGPGSRWVAGQVQRDEKAPLRASNAAVGHSPSGFVRKIVSGSLSVCVCVCGVCVCVLPSLSYYVALYVFSVFFEDHNIIFVTWGSSFSSEFICRQHMLETGVLDSCPVLIQLKVQQSAGRILCSVCLIYLLQMVSGGHAGPGDLQGSDMSQLSPPLLTQRLNLMRTGINVAVSTKCLFSDHGATRRVPTSLILLCFEALASKGLIMDSISLL